MAEFHRLLARLKGALESHPPAAPDSHPSNGIALPAGPTAERAGLVSQFARELEALSAHFIGALTVKEAAAKIAALAVAAGMRIAAVGETVSIKMDPFADALASAGCLVLRPGAVSDEDRPAALEQLARCDLGVVEADCAIASTGTFAVLTTAGRPSSLTLLPPTSVIVAPANRVVPDLAAALSMVGPAALKSQRLSLVTGPSRTADIEKRIVLGVHGPKVLYGALIWPR